MLVIAIVFRIDKNNNESIKNSKQKIRFISLYTQALTNINNDSFLTK
jgi:hypothetical protein